MPRIEHKYPDTWKQFLYEGKTLPYIHIQSNNPNATNLIVFHGSTYPLEYCFEEYQDVVKRYNVNIYSLEYPGFGEWSHSVHEGSSGSARRNWSSGSAYEGSSGSARRNWSSGSAYEGSTETTMLECYPLEVMSWLEYLQLDLQNTILVGQCLGAVMAIRIASQMPPIKCLIITKPFTGWHNLRPICKFMPNVFTNKLRDIRAIQCPVYCVQGSSDTI